LTFLWTILLTEKENLEIPLEVGLEEETGEEIEEAEVLPKEDAEANINSHLAL
jgi:hypothetical protein